MTITIHEDVISILEEESQISGLTLEEAANFLIRHAASAEKPLLVERSAFMKAADGRSLFDYDDFAKRQGWDNL